MHYTKKQYRIMQHIAQYIDRNGIPPTLQEIGDYFRVSKVTIFEHLTLLEKKGAIRRKKGLSRALEIIDTDFLPQSPTCLPLVGNIAAGAPIEAIEDPDLIEIGDMIPRDKTCYMLRVKGESMIDEHIANGDYVIVEKRDSADDGEIVVAIINENEATLKRMYREGMGFRLEPANPKMKPIFTDQLEVRGVVIGVLRKY